MSEAVEELPEFEEDASEARRLRWMRVLGVSSVVMLLAFIFLWSTRETIADNIIARQLRQMELPATYHIESIGPRHQVLTNIVVGDRRNPDLTVERAEIDIEPRLGFPRIGRVTLVRPRLYGTYRQGKLSFGTLDKVLFAPSKEPFRLPDMNLAIVDGRARMLTDYGPIGAKLQGRGPLRDGFTGVVAVIAPRLATGECTANSSSIFGKLTVRSERPRLVGPLRLGGLNCQKQALHLRDIGVDVDGALDPKFDGGAATLGLSGGAMGYGTARASGLNGSVDVAYRKAMLTARYDVLGRGLETPQALVATLAAKGTLRARDGFARSEVEGTLDGGGVRLGDGLNSALAGFERSAQGSLAAPLVAQMRNALVREGRNSRLTASFVLRQAGEVTNLVVPQGSLRGGSGSTVLAISRVQLVAGGDAAPRLAGNFSTGGEGLPQIAGRMERAEGGDTYVRMTMTEYRAGDARMSIPQLVIAQTSKGAIGFNGSVLASGPLPGGRTENLLLPVEGNWASGGTLSLWRRCVTARFDALGYASLTLERRSLVLCPGPGGAIVRYDRSGLKVAAGTSGLDLAGHLGETPIRIASGPIGYARPGTLFVHELDIALGPVEAPTRFRLASLTAEVGKEISGSFEGTDAQIYSVPLDLLGASGKWRFADGSLAVSDAGFRLEDRTKPDRFQPLVAHGATLDLADGKITANALLREPSTDREVARVAIRHDLGSAHGHADLAVEGLTFDDRLQPDTLTRQALGVIANAKGTVKGHGVIDWAGDKVSSSGSFTTDSLDFAAAFGPVKGASGTIEFTDLLGFVTAPHQRLRLASVNPGIEVADGEVIFKIRPYLQMAVEGATWPFLGGTLRLKPAELNLGVAETRRYVLEIEGLDAAKFIERMELGNLAVTGTFDGTLPLVFDQNGGRIEDGVLTSRPPGGNISYVGALTYKDLSPMANYAFQALKSLDYRAMQIGMNGALDGEIVTRVQFDGVKQGAGASHNFITERFARLPLQFNVNIRAPFYQVISSVKAMYDPTFIKDPRTLGLIDENGRPIQSQAANPPPPALKPEDIQPSDSRKTP
jgi:hypothetical protein